MVRITRGDRLDGKYVVKDLLGAGGFGQVYMAEDEVLPHRPVAIKVIADTNSDQKEAMLWEMKHLSALSHPGVVGFYHHFEHGGRLCLVMEHCSGGNLRDRIRAKGPFSIEQVMAWATRLCDTLNVVHAHGIVHHDIKPSNIMFAADDAIKVGDFGIANTRGGTTIYMAPELFLRSNVSHTDPRTDIYALGLTLLEALTGAHPFGGLTETEHVYQRALHAFIPSDLPRWVRELLARATHPVPERRFQTMMEMLETIRAGQVPFALDGARIRASAFAASAERLLTTRQWRRAIGLADHALSICPDSLPALLAAGRCQLVSRRPTRAREFFDRALAISPNSPIQRELGWIHLDQGRLASATSLLADHLQRNPADFEAYNLLLDCYRRSGQFTRGLELATEVLAHKPPSRCFASNAYLFMLLLADGTTPEMPAAIARGCDDLFVGHNICVVRDRPPTWARTGSSSLVAKLLFQEYRFGFDHDRGRGNAVVVLVGGSGPIELTRSIVSIGCGKANDFVFDEDGVSRRHCAILNIRGEVWLYDLGSTCGTHVDGNPVDGRVLLEGVHNVAIGDASIRVSAKRGLLI